ncbi:MAG TPA: type II secretion system protein [Tepidisphaeraceae bacterium]|nr:type II secretion system protein [Tepidisphaeraceae bacterium]
MRTAPASRRGGFTLIELLVVIGIAVLLLGLLMPALRRAREWSRQISCESNLHQIGMYLLSYANESHGWLFPVGPPGANGLPTTLGTNMPRDQRWTVYVFHQWNPRVMLCPSDDQPAEQHSYILNEHLADHKVTYSSTRLGGLYSVDVVVMGEKLSGVGDYFMEESEFSQVVEPFRHGLWYGSNYLYLDLHVSSSPPTAAKKGIDPWDVPLPLPNSNS